LKESQEINPMEATHLAEAHANPHPILIGQHQLHQHIREKNLYEEKVNLVLIGKI
jgi:hypothetical protein